MSWDIGGAGSGTEIAPLADIAFIGVLLALRPAFPPLLLCSWATTKPMMRSLLLVLAALPLASFALVVNRANSEAKDPAQKNGTISNKYWLQRRHQGDTFFKYVEARLFLLSPILSYFCSEWDFFSGSDPTHGNVAYQTRGNSGDLAYVDGDGSAVLRVDNKGNVPVGGKRRS